MDNTVHGQKFDTEEDRQRGAGPSLDTRPGGHVVDLRRSGETVPPLDVASGSHIRTSRPRRVLVTGAAGFIGSHVCDALLARGDTVVGLDNFDNAYDPSIKVRNVRHASRHSAFRLVHGDIRDGDLLDEVFAEGNFDLVLHLAARAGVRPSIVQPALYDAVNVAGTTMVLQRVAAHDVSHVVLASSSSVYGATSVPPFREDRPADQPSSPYAATKRANELAAYAFHHLNGVSVSCLRFFTVYGPRQRPEMAIHKFARMIQAGQQVTVFGDGSSTRDYTFIEDIVAGVLAALDRPRGYRIYNLGTTSTVQLSDLVQKLSDLLGLPADVAHLPVQDGDVPTTHADISLARRELAYNPLTPIDQGLERFVAWFLSAGDSFSLPRELMPLSRRSIDEVVDLAVAEDRTLEGRAS